MKKFTAKKFICAFSAMMILGVGSVTASATNHDFSFTFTNTSTTKYTSYYAKSDSDQFYVISLDTTNKNTGVKNTMSASNIFGCKMHRSYSDNVDVYHTFSNYVTGYRIAYQVPVYKNDNMRLAGKKDTASTSSATLRISGRFAP